VSIDDIKLIQYYF